MCDCAVVLNITYTNYSAKPENQTVSLYLLCYLFLAELERQDGVSTEFDENLWYSLVDFVTVFNKEDIRFTFKNGTEIKV